MNNIKDIGKYKLFDGLTEEQLSKFKKVIQVRKFSADKVIFNEGDVGDSIYLLLNGKIEINQALTLKLSKEDYDTREKSITKLSSNFRPSFGELSLFGDNDKRTATVIALSDCEMGIIMRDDFFSILESNYDLGYRVMHNIACIVVERLIKTNQDVLKLTTALSLILEK